VANPQIRPPPTSLSPFPSPLSHFLGNGNSRNKRHACIILVKLAKKKERKEKEKKKRKKKEKRTRCLTLILVGKSYGDLIKISHAEHRGTNKSGNEFFF
jgi:uncharacterized membrane protein